MPTGYKTPAQVVDWWEHRLADMQARLMSVREELADGEDAASDWRELMSERVRQLHNDIAEAERVQAEWRKLA